MATEVGKGFVEVVADLDKFGASISKGMSGQQAAFAKSGSDAGKSFGTGVEKEIAGKQSIFSKLGAQQGGVFGTAMSGAIAGGALAGGAAIGAFAVNAIGHFQKTAIAADKFRDTTGLALDESSRWIAVADDVGIGADTIESAFKRMETSIDKNRTAFGDLIVTTASGATDLSATFLNVVEHVQSIEDPIARANEATKLFGRGFGEISELITTDADKLKESLAGVGDFQIINDDQVAKAREFDKSMDALAETLEHIKMDLGESLVPLVSGLADAVVQADKLTQAVGGVATFLDPTLMAGGVKGIQDVASSSAVLEEIMRRLKPIGDESVAWMTAHRAAADGSGTAVRQAAVNVEALTTAFGGFEGRAAGLGDQMTAYADATAAADQATKDLTASILGLVGGEHEIRAAQQAVIEATERANEVNADGLATTLEKQIADDNAVQSILTLADANRTQAEASGDADAGQQAFISTLEYLSGTASPGVQTQLQGVIGKLKETGEQKPEPTVTLDDQASQPIADVKGKVDGLDAARASITVNETGNAIDRLGRIESAISRINGMRLGISTSIPGFASGIANFAGGLAMVGEEGPELVHLPPGTTVDSAAKTRASISAVTHLGGGLGPRQPIVIVNQGTFLGTEEAFGKLADRAIAQARRAGNRAA